MPQKTILHSSRKGKVSMAKRIVRQCKSSEDSKKAWAAAGFDAGKVKEKLTYTGIEFELSDKPVQELHASLRAALERFAGRVDKLDKGVADAIRTLAVAKVCDLSIINAGCQNPMHFAKSGLPALAKAEKPAAGFQPLEW